MLKLLIATARFPHIIRILARLGHPARIIAVVINYATEDRVPIVVPNVSNVPPASL